GSDGSEAEGQVGEGGQAEAEMAQGEEGRDGRGGGGDLEERLEELAEDLESIDDPELNKLAQELRQQMRHWGRAPGGNMRGLPGLEVDERMNPIKERLHNLIDEIVKRKMRMSGTANVPDEYRRLVDRYFKALSDDLGDAEVSETPEAATTE
ncbi:MAG: hypothetical protein ACLFQ6_07935, partial [Candidatus Sumerlaeia bacterium]